MRWRKGWWRPECRVHGVLIVHRKFRLSRVRHPEPFSKSDRGRQRREERRHRREQEHSEV